MKQTYLKNLAITAFAMSAIISSTSAFAGQPTVSCGLSYTKLDSNGYLDANQKPIYGTVKLEKTFEPKEIKIKGFKVTLGLGQLCAADDGECSDLYSLGISISKGNSVAQSSGNDIANEKRYSALLKKGREEVLVNCEVHE
ncbi:MAG: hypothetical protein KDD34_00945 [Bdellovibrionales bacterium]|nr:hypothetical protein [Bdellovibrionales bacterium]